MRLLFSITILVVLFICGCESQKQISITKLPPTESENHAAYLKLFDSTEGKKYIDKIFSTIDAKIDVLENSPTPLDTSFKVRFNVYQDGTISDIQILENTNSTVASRLVEAIKDCSPLPKWSDKMRSIAGQDVFEWNCDFGFNLTVGPG